MLSQGWNPGEFLGAKDAPHASLHSKANASHIRVALKDDNLGLGAKRGPNTGEGQCTGLEIFQDVLGRLNGKEQKEIKAEQRSRAVLRRAVYAEKRWGSLRFVSGGLLIGDEIQKFAEENNQPLLAPEITPLQPSQIKRRRKPEDLAKPEGLNHAEEPPRLHNSKTSRKASKRDKKRIPSGTVEPDFERPPAVSGDINAALVAKLEDHTRDHIESRQLNTDKATLRAEKAERKLKRRSRREAKKAYRAEQNIEPSTASITTSLQRPISASVIEPSPMLAIRSASDRDVTPRDLVVGGRLVVRQRYIRHKKMAMMDTKALNEVWHPQGSLG